MAQSQLKIQQIRQGSEGPRPGGPVISPSPALLVLRPVRSYRQALAKPGMNRRQIIKGPPTEASLACLFAVVVEPESRQSGVAQSGRIALAIFGGFDDALGNRF